MHRSDSMNMRGCPRQRSKKLLLLLVVVSLLLIVNLLLPSGFVVGILRRPPGGGGWKTGFLVANNLNGSWDWRNASTYVLGTSGPYEPSQGEEETHSLRQDSLALDGHELDERQGSLDTISQTSEVREVSRKPTEDPASSEQENKISEGSERGDLASHTRLLQEQETRTDAVSRDDDYQFKSNRPSSSLKHQRHPLGVRNQKQSSTHNAAPELEHQNWQQRNSNKAIKNRLPFERNYHVVAMKQVPPDQKSVHFQESQKTSVVDNNSNKGIVYRTIPMRDADVNSNLKPRYVAFDPNRVYNDAPKRQPGRPSSYASRMASWFTAHDDILEKYEEPDSTPEAIRLDLERCSLAMGVPLEHLRAANNSLKNISRRASRFLSAVRSVIPREFSGGFRNPCFETNKLSIYGPIASLLAARMSTSGVFLTRREYLFLANRIFYEPNPMRKRNWLICFPHFFISGFAKSGTSTLDNALRKHPGVAAPVGKEPHWWTRIPLQDMQADYLRLTVVKYILEFAVADRLIYLDHSLITYDASQSTLWDSNFFANHQDYCSMPAVMSRVLPQAKFIVMMRNPITRLYSHYVWSCTFKFGNHTAKWPRGMEKNIPQFFHNEVLLDVEYFNKCTEKTSAYECTNLIRYEAEKVKASKEESGKENCGALGFRTMVGLYYVHLVKWLQFFPKEQFLFLKMEDMAQEPVKFFSTVEDFLGLESVSEAQAESWLGRKINAQKVVDIYSPEFQMFSKTRKLLADFYRPYNRKLAELTSDGRFLWED